MSEYVKYFGLSKKDIHLPSPVTNSSFCTAQTFQKHTHRSLIFIQVHDKSTLRLPPQFSHGENSWRHNRDCFVAFGLQFKHLTPSAIQNNRSRCTKNKWKQCCPKNSKYLQDTCVNNISNTTATTMVKETARIFRIPCSYLFPQYSNIKHIALLSKFFNKPPYSWCQTADSGCITIPVLEITICH